MPSCRGHRRADPAARIYDRAWSDVSSPAPDPLFPQYSMESNVRLGRNEPWHRCHIHPPSLAVPEIQCPLHSLRSDARCSLAHLGSCTRALTLRLGPDHVHRMPAVNVGHPDAGCEHGIGPGCAAAAYNETA